MTKVSVATGMRVATAGQIIYFTPPKKTARDWLWEIVWQTGIPEWFQSDKVTAGYFPVYPRNSRGDFP